MVCMRCGSTVADSDYEQDYELCTNCAQAITVQCPHCREDIPLPEFVNDLSICPDCFSSTYGKISTTRWRNLYRLVLIGGIGVLNIFLMAAMVLMVFEFFL